MEIHKYDPTFPEDNKTRVLAINADGSINFAPAYTSATAFAIDQAGRQRMSLPIPLGDYKLINDRLPLFFDTEVIGTGAVSYDTVKKAHDMTTGANSDAAIVQTFMTHNYFAGKAQFVEFTSFDFDNETNITKRSGYFSSNEVTPFDSNKDGFFIETDGTTHYLVITRDGTEHTKIAQADWNDSLDGNGASGITIDWAKFNVFQANFLWLGGTGLTISIVVGKAIYEIVNYIHANGTNADNLIFASPNKPIRHEIRQSGAGSGQFKPVCSTVASEGSSDSANIGSIRAVNSGSAPITCATAGTEYVIKAIKLKDAYKDTTIDVLDLDVFANSANDAFLWKISLNPTLSAPLTYSNVTDSAIQEADGDGVITSSGGYEIASGYVSSNSTLAKALDSARKLGSTIDGTRDQIVLTVTGLTGETNVASFGSINYKEFV